MSTSARPESSDAPLLALAGAGSLLGKEIKEQLAASGFPAAAVTLLELEELAGVLTDYGDEARVLLEAATEKILNHDVACFCGNPEFAAEHLDRLLDAGHIGLDCTGAWSGRDDVFLWLPGLSPAPRLDTHHAIALPGTGTMLLGTALAALADLAEGAAASLFLPASEHGEAGLHELSRQTIAVLNVEDIGETLFGRQLAFDLWPTATDGTGGVTSIGNELRRLGLPVPAINVLSAGVFHGIALSLFLPRAAAAEVAEALAAAGLAADDEPCVDSPVRAAGHRGFHAGGVRQDPAGGTWTWIVGDNLAARAAAAIAAIHALLGPAAGGRPATV